LIFKSIVSHNETNALSGNLIIYANKFSKYNRDKKKFNIAIWRRDILDVVHHYKILFSNETGETDNE